MIWFNPSFNNAVKTNVERMPLNLLEKGFLKGQTLKKTFTGNSIRNNYSFIDNYAAYNVVLMLD